VHKYYDYEIRTLRVGDPSRVEIPVSMHIGAPSVPVVKEGDHVNVGDLIAETPEGAMGALIHASISGRVESVGNRIVIVKD
jgi:Na+-translocating ferredoxin:NAD+ oxidoreductase RnfC subunit